MTQYNLNPLLICPLSLDLLEDPVTLPCCGQVVSRQMLGSHLSIRDTCPMCRSNLHSDVSLIPRAVVVGDMVDEARLNLNKAEVDVHKTDTSEIGWKCKCEKIVIDSKNISRLEFSTTSDIFQCKTMLVPVVDLSASMSGTPLNQVKYSLTRMLDLVYRNSCISSCIITYSDDAETIEIDKTRSIEYYKKYIDNLKIIGGTQFVSAFNQILQLIKNTANSVEITSIVFIFLTDGQDNYGKNAVKKFAQDFNEVCLIPSTIHSVGFGASHDLEFLNSLRIVGSNEGAYRYADPNENSDCLSGKLNSILTVVENSKSYQIEILDNNLDVLSSDQSVFWLSNNIVNNYKLNIMVNKTFTYSVIVDVENINNNEIKSKWLSILVDNIAVELINIKKNDYLPLQLNIHCELIKQRLESINERLDSSSNDIERIKTLCDTASLIADGQNVDLMHLNDLKFEGKYKTEKSSISLNIEVPKITQYKMVEQIRFPDKWQILKDYRRPRSNFKKMEISTILGNYKTSKACDWLQKNRLYITSLFNLNNANCLIVASSLGRYTIVKQLINYNIFDINAVDNFGYTATDYAAVHGYWQTLQLLTENKGECKVDGSSLLRTCLSNNYKNTAQKLIYYKIATIDQNLIDSAPTNEIFSWLSNAVSKNINVDEAISKGILSLVIDQLDQAKFQSSPDMSMFHSPKPEHYDIFKLLLSKNLIDPFAIVKVNGEDTWPFFAICEKGNSAMFDLVIEHVNKDTLIEKLNQQNGKGTTVLWIASCNKHIEIVIKLLDLKCNVNIENNKGESAIIPCCQKGSVEIIDLLLQSGCRVDSFNKNRDNALLICCRNGQHNALQVLLEHCIMHNMQNMVEYCADIDGFNSLIAACESDKPFCIELCVKYGANIEFCTDNTNEILAGATGLHIACLYNKIDSVKCLYKLGANFKAQTLLGYTCLHIAIRQGHTELVKLLLHLKEGKQLLEISDCQNKLPKYYCNDQLYKDFFINKMSKLLFNFLFISSNELTCCIQTMIKYGKSYGVYDYSNFIDVPVKNGMSIYCYALLTKNKQLIDYLKYFNPNKTIVDDYNISPEFWEVYLEYNVTTNNEIIKQVNVVKQVTQSTNQNKYIMSLNKNVPKFLNQSVQINTIDKMNDGYRCTSLITEHSLNDIQTLSARDCTLVGLLESLKQPKYFADGLNCLDNILWETKIHTLKLIACGDKLQPLNIMALYLISSNQNIFKQVNLSLENWSKTNIWKALSVCVYQSLTLLPNYIGEVYRAVDCQFNAVDLKIGGTIEWNTFSTCSLEQKSVVEQLSKQSGIVFIINSKSCKNISKYSAYPGDSEMMFLPATKFYVENYYKPSIIALNQKNIRKVTYKVNDIDIEKAVMQKTAIIVEISEI